MWIAMRVTWGETLVNYCSSIITCGEPSFCWACLSNSDSASFVKVERFILFITLCVARFICKWVISGKQMLVLLPLASRASVWSAPRTRPRTASPPQSRRGPRAETRLGWRCEWMEVWLDGGVDGRRCGWGESDGRCVRRRGGRRGGKSVCARGSGRCELELRKADGRTIVKRSQ